MTCAAIRSELLSFHFGIIGETPREEVERHLMRCPDCVGEFLALKRDVELSTSTQEHPNGEVKSKVRAAVAKELGLVATLPLWWQRPLAFALAATAIVVAMVSVETVATSKATAPLGIAAVHGSR
jgi:anti-sigma factor RsiW